VSRLNNLNNRNDARLANRRDSGRQHQVTVYRSGNRLEIETWLAGHGVNAESRSLPSPGPNPFIEIKTDGEVIGIIGVEAIEALLEPPIYRPGDQNGISGVPSALRYS